MRMLQYAFQEIIIIQVHIKEKSIFGFPVTLFELQAVKAEDGVIYYATTRMH